MARGRATRLIAAQVLLGSLGAWALCGTLSLSLSVFGDRAWREAVQLGCMFSTLLVVAYGAVGLGGGEIAIPTRIFRDLNVEHRERVTDHPGGLTPLGLALFVVPQLVGGAVLVG